MLSNRDKKYYLDLNRISKNNEVIKEHDSILEELDIYTIPSVIFNNKEGAVLKKEFYR